MLSSFILFDFFKWTFLIDMPTESGFKDFFVLLLFGLLIYALIKVSGRSIKVVHAHWHYMFDTHPFTPLEFYDSLKVAIGEKEINGASFVSINHSERGLLSANREYLRVKFREYMMDLCAAPFAKESFFVSWWLGDAGITFRDYLTTIPVIGRLFNRREKTFYEQDTEIMFKETVARCVKDTIEQLTQSKGLRQPDLSGWKGSDIQFQS